MRYAILSDVHSRREKLQAVLADAQSRGVDRIVSLGDVGGDECLGLLHRAGAVAVFGNYEVSGWQRLRPEYRDWVRTWTPLLVEEGFLAVHAVPWWPEGLATIDDFRGWIKSDGRSWRAIFPYLSEDEDLLWQVLAELETAGKPILFHGHTHRQGIWHWAPSGRLRRLRSASIATQAGHHYAVGVGSVGLPEDGCWAAYGLYDTDAGRIELLKL